MKGGCLCGGIRYEVSGKVDPQMQFYVSLSRLPASYGYRSRALDGCNEWGDYLDGRAEGLSDTTRRERC